MLPHFSGQGAQKGTLVDHIEGLAKIERKKIGEAHDVAVMAEVLVRNFDGGRAEINCQDVKAVVAQVSRFVG